MRIYVCGLVALVVTLGAGVEVAAAGEEGNRGLSPIISVNIQPPTSTNRPVEILATNNLLADGMMADASASPGSLVAATATGAQGQYDVAYSMCQTVIPADSAVDFLNVVNAIYPTNAAWKYFHDRGVRIEASDSIKVTLIDAPKHGVLEHGHVYGAYLYKPNEDYFGGDRMFFSVEVKGKVFKVIYSVDVVLDPDRGSPSCPSSPSINELPTKPHKKQKPGALQLTPVLPKA